MRTIINGADDCQRGVGPLAWDARINIGVGRKILSAASTTHHHEETSGVRETVVRGTVLPGNQGNQGVRGPGLSEPGLSEPELSEPELSADQLPGVRTRVAKDGVAKDQDQRSCQGNKRPFPWSSERGTHPTLSNNGMTG
jgi:hypothetical protein